MAAAGAAHWMRRQSRSAHLAAGSRGRIGCGDLRRRAGSERVSRAGGVVGAGCRTRERCRERAEPRGHRGRRRCAAAATVRRPERAPERSRGAEGRRRGEEVARGRRLRRRRSRAGRSRGRVRRPGLHGEHGRRRSARVDCAGQRKVAERRRAAQQFRVPGLDRSRRKGRARSIAGTKNVRGNAEYAAEPWNEPVQNVESTLAESFERLFGAPP
jgi:hypothetical protein